MRSKSLRQNTLCINVEKVYDWIIEESSGSTSIPVGNLPVSLPANATDVEVTCYLSNETGAPLPLNSEVVVTETAPREDRQFEVDGVQVTLQRVTFTKTLFAVIKVSGVDPDTGGQFLITSNPAPFTFIETAYLCAPPGTLLNVRISDFGCLTVIRRGTNDAIIAFGLSIFVCQSIQTFAPVTIEVASEFCMPRDTLAEPCLAPMIPSQCPVVFPKT